MLKTAPPARAPFLGLAQQRVALMCGPGPGLLSVYKSRCPFGTPLLVRRDGNFIHGSGYPWIPDPVGQGYGEHFRSWVHGYGYP